MDRLGIRPKDIYTHLLLRCSGCMSDSDEIGTMPTQLHISLHRRFISQISCSVVCRQAAAFTDAFCSDNTTAAAAVLCRLRKSRLTVVQFVRADGLPDRLSDVRDLVYMNSENSFLTDNGHWTCSNFDKH